MPESQIHEHRRQLLVSGQRDLATSPDARLGGIVRRNVAPEHPGLGRREREEIAQVGADRDELPASSSFRAWDFCAAGSIHVITWPSDARAESRALA